SEEVCRTLEKQKKLIAALQAEKGGHLKKIAELNDELVKNLETLRALALTIVL
ncbi:hypothetical protein A2U01_0040134, partial [Trifolium medium]|nr:hypothetical protein [Trifolium medium]